MPMTNQRLQEYLKAERGFTNADISTARDSTVFHSVAGFREVAAVGSCAAVADAETMTLTLLQATDASGAGKKVLGTARIATCGVAAGSVLANIVSALVEEMDHANDFTFVGARIESDAAVEGQVVLLLGGARYSPQSQDTA